MFAPEDILYEDNHLMVVAKRAGDLVQPDPEGGSALENEIKAFLKVRDAKPGDVFLGVVHRIDRPVSGAVLFAKTSKALARLNEMIKERRIRKTYLAIVEGSPHGDAGLLVGNLVRDGRTNKSRIVAKPTSDSKEARLEYRIVARGDRYSLLEVDLLTGRHHQIRCQLAALGNPIRGDLKYGAARSLPAGGISLHSYSIGFVHPVKAQGEEPRTICVTAPPPAGDKLWGTLLAIGTPGAVQHALIPEL